MSEEEEDSDGQEVAESDNEQVESAFEQPESPFDEPESAIDQLKLASDQPESASDQPESATDQPESATDQPKSATDQPKSATDQPKSATDQPKSASDQPKSTAADSRQDVPVMRSYLAKRGKAQLATNQVRLEAAKLLPKLRHSQPGIGFYGRVRERVTSRSVELWSRQQAIGQPSLVLGPSSDLTDHYYSETPVQGKKMVASSSCGSYPFSRIIYSNLIGQEGQPIRAGESSLPANQRVHGLADSTVHRPQRTPAAFVLRNKLRQSTTCLSRILDAPSPNAANARRARSQIK